LNGSVNGLTAIKRADSSVVVYSSKAVILAGGGYAGIYRGFTTNAQDYTGDMHAIALRAGLNLKDMEFVQFHPTGFVRTSYLVSEAARAEGGYLVNSDGKRFVNELDTRDVVSSAIAKEIKDGKEVFIDLRHLSQEHIETKLPSLYKSAFMQAGIDITKELLPIKPVVHYTMGGIEAFRVNTSLKGLFVCGECASNGVHGANRLGGNSLLEGAVFGDLAGKKAREFAEKNELLPIDYNDVERDIERVEKIFEDETTKNFNAMRITLGRTMFEHVGILREENSLVKAFDYLRYLRREAMGLHCIDKSRSNNVELIAILELRNALDIAEIVVLGAIERKESRGAHKRSDFEATRENFKNSVYVNEIQKGFFKVWLKEKTVVDKLLNILKRR
jgi:succinate dehydrogenase/fumarate reductase flavoprotein subunit